MEFCTVLHSLKSPQNVGMIIRSFEAHNGNFVLFTGDSLPWQFKKGSTSFSRKLENRVQIKHIPNPTDAIDYLSKQGYAIVSLEISKQSTLLPNFTFPDRVALVVGNEANGLPLDFLELSDAVVTIPQYGKVGSLNVAVSASIAMYELTKSSACAEISGDEFV